MKLSGIYKIENVVNNKVYVGSSVNIGKRWLGHKNSLRHRKHHSSILQRSWDKYGEASFKFEILETVEDRLLLLQREQHWIDCLGSAKRGSGLNVRLVAESPSGTKHSEESKRKISIANTGVKRPPVSDETKRKISEANRGNKFSLETRQKMSAYRLGRKRKPFTDEHKKRISLSKLGKKMAPRMGPSAVKTPEHRAKLSAAMSRVQSEKRQAKIPLFPVSG